ncbi:MAG: protein rep [Nitrospirae bacterium]|nr:protein rep [Nitrospirota bacterium]
MAELSHESEKQDSHADAQAGAAAWRQPAPDPAWGVRGDASPPASLEDSTTSAQREEATLPPLPVPHEIRSLYCAHCGEKKRITIRCQGRTCPECRRADFWRLMKGYEGLAETMENPKLATFTVPNMKRLTKEAFLSITRAFKKLFRRKFYQERVRGGIFTVETTNHGNGWHPHLHVLLDADYLAQRKLDADWKKLTGGMVDIRARTPQNALPYMLKYVGKAPDIYRTDQNKGLKRYCSPDERIAREIEFNAAMKGIRMVQPFGSLYGKEKPVKSVLTCSTCGGTDWISEWGLQSMIDAGEVMEVKPQRIQHEVRADSADESG